MKRLVKINRGMKMNKKAKTTVGMNNDKQYMFIVKVRMIMYVSHFTVVPAAEKIIRSLLEMQKISNDAEL